MINETIAPKLLSHSAPGLAPLGPVAEGFQAQLREKDEKIKELRQELQDMGDLVDKLREHIEDRVASTEQWIDAFNMQLNEKGELEWQSRLVEQYDELHAKYSNLLKEWNKFVPEYNGVINRKPIGRPLAASEEQAKAVLKRRKAGESLRKIAVGMNLGLGTVRTIAGKPKGTDRTSKARKELRRREFDRLRAADYRRRQALRKHLPKRISEIQSEAAALVKEVKGLGKAKG